MWLCAHSQQRETKRQSMLVADLLVSNNLACVETSAIYAILLGSDAQQLFSITCGL